MSIWRTSTTLYSRGMRIVVSGTHASGKSTLVSDFALRHPEFAVLPDPFTLVDESWDAPSASLFAAQLRISAARLDPDEAAQDLIAERGPIDFLAYLLALDDVTGASSSRELLERATEMTREALVHVDLLVVLPLTLSDEMAPDADEHLALREAMNDVLLDLIDDPDIVGERTRVVEIGGDRGHRLAALEAFAIDSTRVTAAIARLTVPQRSSVAKDRKGSPRRSARRGS